MGFFAFDKQVYMRRLHLPGYSGPLEARAVTKPALNLQRHIDSRRDQEFARLMAGAKSQGTISQYDRTFAKLQGFCESQSIALTDLTAGVLEEYFLILEITKASYSFVAGLKGAIKFMCTVLTMPSLWNDKIQLAYEALLRRSGIERPPPSKAELLPPSVLFKAIDLLVLPYLSCVDEDSKK